MTGIQDNGFGQIKWIFGGLVVAYLLLTFGGKHPKNIKPADDQWFQTEVVQETKPVLVKFGADWCPPCRSTDKALDEYAKISNGTVKVVLINVDEDRDLASHYGVGSIPHSFIFYKGEVLDDRVGGMEVDEIGSWVKSTVSNLSSRTNG